MTDTIRSLLEQDDERDLYRIPTDEGTLVVAVSELLATDVGGWDLDRPAEWHAPWNWLQITDGSEEPPFDKWHLLSEEERDRVWAEADKTGSYHPRELAEIDRRVNGETR